MLARHIVSYRVARYFCPFFLSLYISVLRTTTRTAMSSHGAAWETVLSRHCCCTTATTWPQHPVAMEEYALKETNRPWRNHHICLKPEQQHPCQCLPSCACARARWRRNRGEEGVRRLKTPQADAHTHPTPPSTITVNTWTCACGGTRGSTYDSELCGNGGLFGEIVGTGTIKGLCTPLSGLGAGISGETEPTGRCWIRGGGNWFCCISSVFLLR